MCRGAKQRRRENEPHQAQAWVVNGVVNSVIWFLPRSLDFAQLLGGCYCKAKLGVYNEFPSGEEMLLVIRIFVFFYNWHTLTIFQSGKGLKSEQKVG